MVGAFAFKSDNPSSYPSVVISFFLVNWLKRTKKKRKMFSIKLLCPFGQIVTPRSCRHCRIRIKTFDLHFLQKCKNFYSSPRLRASSIGFKILSRQKFWHCVVALKWYFPAAVASSASTARRRQSRPRLTSTNWYDLFPLWIISLI